MMQNLLQDLTGFFTPERLNIVLRVVLILAVGLIVLRIITVLSVRMTSKFVSPQHSMLLKKGIFYTGSILILFTALRQMGFNLTALIGAAGIAGIAIGFAAQTSVSNLISGLFLISEKPFEVGDAITAGDTTGIILSIDLLSVKIRTFDNRYIRIPNEKLLNSELVNITRFPIRRLNIKLSVAYKSDINQVRSVLLELAQANPYCLDEPEPLLVFNDFGASGLEFNLGLWFEKSDSLNLKNSIMQEIKERFDREGIKVPFPHLSVYAGSETEAFPVQITKSESPQD
jgi:small-conductance mechanosensitive channel